MSMQPTAKIPVQTSGEATMGPDPGEHGQDRQLYTVCKTSWSRVCIHCSATANTCVDTALLGHALCCVHCLPCRLGATGLSLTSTVVLVGLARPALDGNNLHTAHHADSNTGVA